ncbi:MAG: signal recognition particle protein, partial [Candidatus Fraserbacteria bacterium RBG_16_55_9]
ALKRKGKLTETDLDEGLREVRRALLEADVNYKVVKRFVDDVRTKALGQAITESLNPGQQIIKIVRDELTALMGKEKADLSTSQRPAVWMVVGLQGSGKTTTVGKVAKHFSRQGKRLLLAATDIRRPAAIEQLKQLGSQLTLPVYAQGKTPLEIAQGSLSQAKQQMVDILVLDTAGRLQMDEVLMEELAEMKGKLNPSEILLVADAMTGQEAVAIAEAFNARLGLTGIILTKMDGDARGGAALSMVEVTGRPIVFLGVGEKLDDLESFHPDRLAQRILGMGDVLGLIEEVEKKIDTKKAEEFAKKLEKERFTLEDFQQQLEQVRSLGPLDKLLEKLPGVTGIKGQVQIDERELVRVQAIINSMTLEERRHPEVLNASRKKRIARGSGTQVSDINRVLKRFEEAKAMIKKMKRMGGRLPQGGWPF